jgi:hypothetical protein
MTLDMRLGAAICQTTGLASVEGRATALHAGLRVRADGKAALRSARAAVGDQVQLSIVAAIS